LLAIAEAVADDGAANPHPDYVQQAREAAIAAGKAGLASRTHSNVRLLLLADLRDLFDVEWIEDQKRAAPLFATAAEVELFSEAIVNSDRGPSGVGLGSRSLKTSSPACWHP
jgi:hypothetical protein